MNSVDASAFMPGSGLTLQTLGVAGFSLDSRTAEPFITNFPLLMAAGDTTSGICPESNAGRP